MYLCFNNLFYNKSVVSIKNEFKVRLFIYLLFIRDFQKVVKMWANEEMKWKKITS